MKARALLAGLLSICLYAGLANAQKAPTDFDGDGRSEFVLLNVQKDDEKSFSWKYYNTATAEQVLLGRLGKQGDIPLAADWDGSGSPQVGIITTDRESKQLTWTALLGGVRANRKFGKEGDLILAGADFNGNGYADAAVARLGKRNAIWEIFFDPFGPVSHDTKKIAFGKNGDRVFFVSPDGASDWLGIVRKGRGRSSTIILRNVETAEERTIAHLRGYASSGSRPRPVPLKTAGGPDILVFPVQSKKSTRLYLQALTNAAPAVVDLPGKGELAVGDFLAQEGEEVAMRNETGFYVYSPADQSTYLISAPDGMPVDEVSVSATSGDSSGGGSGSSGSCQPQVSIKSLSGVLYKSENVHGGRGPSFIVQNYSERPGHHPLELRDVKCNVIGRLGFYQEGPPYGARYYSRVPGGSYADGKTLLSAALRAGSSNFLIQGNGKWILVSSPTVTREGNCCVVP